MEFWNSVLTEKSWNVLKEIKGKFNFVLIGGWAAYLWTGLHKSKDIDIVIKNMKDLSMLKQKYELKKNDNLKKYEISFEEIDVDIYVPFFSKLALPMEKVIRHTAVVQNIEVVKPEVLLILKQGAEADREFSVKGEKDRIDIMTLLCFANIDFRLYKSLLKEENLESYNARLKKIVSSFKDYNYLNLTPRQLKLKKEEIMKRLI